MATRSFRDGKQRRPKTAPTGKRYLCARCRKRSPRKVFTPAPWYCPKCADSPEHRTIRNDDPAE